MGEKKMKYTKLTSYKHKLHCYDYIRVWVTEGNGVIEREPMVIQNQQKCVGFFLCF